MNPFQPDDECVGQHGEGHRHNGMPGTVEDTAWIAYLEGSVEIVSRREYLARVSWADGSTTTINVRAIRRMTIEDRIPFLVAAADILARIRDNGVSNG